MKVVWKTVLIITLVLVLLGMLAGIVGLATGGSVERMIDVFFGSRESFEMILRALREDLMGLA